MADKDKDVDVSEAIKSPSPVTVYGVVIGGVSPMKTSKMKSGVKYFDNTFTDGAKKLYEWYLSILNCEISLKRHRKTNTQLL